MTDPRPVLYVEDLEVDTVMLRMAFRRVGIEHRLVVIPRGADALDYLLGRGQYGDRAAFPLPRLVLLDVKLPDLSGFQVMREALTRDLGPHVPFVVFTASTNPTDQHKAAYFGAAEYIVKPPDAAGYELVARGLQERWLDRLQAQEP